METSSETIMGALLSLNPTHFSDLTRTLAADLRLRHRRLATLILSPHHFSHTLAHLHSLTFAQKALLLARLLLRSLSLLLPFSAPRHHLRLQDLDAALLLMAMCDVHEPNTHVPDWRTRLTNHLLTTILSSASLATNSSWVIAQYTDDAVKCLRLLDVVSAGDKESSDTPASAAAVVALPSVECKNVGWECPICKDDVEVGRDVCKMPCEHVFHWMCILPWLKKRNTCPYCRFELPTDDVFGEIGRVWRTAARMCGRDSGEC